MKSLKVLDFNEIKCYISSSESGKASIEVVREAPDVETSWRKSFSKEEVEILKDIIDDSV